jgi:two-component sensor histidine kinase
MAIDEPSQRLTAKLQSIGLLYDLSSRLIASSTLEQTLDEILAAANALHGTTLGRVQLYDSAENYLEMVAQQGFASNVFDRIRTITPDDRFASARALHTRKMIVIPDIALDQEYAPYVGTALKGGYRSMIAAPLISSGGEIIGVLSIYFPAPHKPSRREYRITELYARQAANIIARFRAERALRETEETLRLANRELYHRSKNMLAVIQSIAGQTLRTTRDPEKFVEAFNGRLRAIDRAQSLLTGAGHHGVAIADLIREQAILDAETERRMKLSGPAIILEPQLALNLGLVFHELATNAWRFGALSVPQGRVTINWDNERRGDGRLLMLEWMETDGPPVSAPGAAGFGTALIDRVAKSAQDAEAGIRFDANGIVCTMRVPLPPAAHPERV